MQQLNLMESPPGAPPGANPEPIADAQAKVYTLAEHQETAKRIQRGEITAEELKATFERVLASEAAIKAELNAKTLKELCGGGGTGGLKKAEIIERVWDKVLARFVVADGITWQPFSEKYIDAIKRQVAAGTDEAIQAKAAKRKAYNDELKRVLSDPQTLADFERFIEYKGANALTPAQRLAYEQLKAESTKERRTEARARTETVAKVEAPEGLAITIRPGTHTKRNCPIWTAQLNQRVEREKYNELNIKAKMLGGYYSSYGPRELHGFIFFEEESAKKFAGITAGDVSRADELQRWQAESKEQTAARLRELADSTEARANESLAVERKENTARRAGMAASAEARARQQLRLASTLRKLADGIEAGGLKFLDRVRAVTQVVTLEHLTRSAMYNATRANKERYNEARQPLLEDMQHADYPWPNVSRSWLLSLCHDLRERDGFKLVCARLAKVANHYAGEDWITTKGRGQLLADLQELQGKLWGAQNHRREYLRERFDTYARLQAMDIRTELELRAALREYMQLRAAPVQADPVKAAIRDLAGRKIAGYFPTPPDVVDEVLDLAELEQHHRILEPSAGSGNLLDGIRERFDVAPEVLDCCEIDSSLRAILQAKGYNVVAQDFLSYAGGYDRIVMNPPFEDTREIDHVRHAYQILNPGGVLVSVMSTMPFFHKDKKSVEFRAWVANVGEKIDLPPGSFLESTRPTGTNTVIVKIQKPS